MKWAFKDARNAAFLFIAFRFVCPLEIFRPGSDSHDSSCPLRCFSVPIQPAIGSRSPLSMRHCEPLQVITNAIPTPKVRLLPQACFAVVSKWDER
jgi:hypothetical protein